MAECKWQDLDPAEEKGILERLRLAFSATKLAQRYPKVEFRVFSKRSLGRLAEREV